LSLIGRTLSRYQILDEISRGGMGVVYRARDVRLNREVALKVLPPDLVADPDRRQRFVQEARAASALEHPHIAVIHEIDEVDGISFIAMELVRGDQLAHLTARGPLPASRALEIAGEVAEGLARAHEKGVVHRDLKPANVMLTEDGHAKIIDFGLAKLIDALSGDSGGETIVKAETDPGMVMGTVTYMSPEQARGGKVDHRSDIFSFGVLLHEMLTGRPPFRGNTGIDTMHAILHSPVPALPALGPTVTAEATADVQRILEKCLAKDPADRYQGMRDVAVDLRAARRRLESTGVSAISAAAGALSTREGFMHARQWAYGAVALAVLALVAGGALRSRWTSSAGSAAPAASDKPSVAVLYFENNTGNPQLDWLRTGLTDMLVTDLSQSPDVEVLGTDRLVQILTDMKRQDDRVVSFDTVQELAKRAGVKSVLLGSYVKSGETIRINIKLQEAATGKIVTSERVEAANESSLFPTVDDLTRRIKAKFALPSNINPTRGLLNPPVVMSTTTGSGIDRDLKEVTTSSIDAYRYYAEGVNLHERLHDAESIPLLEKAVEIDPQFAVALAKLSIVHSNLGHTNKAEEYAKQSLTHIDRLTARERYYIEGNYYAQHDETIGKAIDAYKKAIELYPDHASSRNNLALRYRVLDRHEDAIREYEELRRRGMTFSGSYTGLAVSYASLNQTEKANDVLQDYIKKNPDNGAAYATLGLVLGSAGKFDEAMAAFERSEALAPGNPQAVNGKRGLYVLAEKWADVEAADRKLRQSSDPTQAALGNGNLASDALYKGRSNDALRFFEAAVATQGPKGSNQSAIARAGMASLLLDKGQPSLALEQARRAFDDAHGGGATWESLFQTARAQARLGHDADAEKTAAELKRRADLLPSPREQRHVHQLAGLLALEHHDTARAIAELKAAQAVLTPGFGVTPEGFGALPHANVWFALGSAELAAGNRSDAAAHFQRIVDGGRARVGSPLEFVRSLYLLGQINEQTGDRARASAYYRRFLQYWGEGDIDRERVAEAKKKMN
jgi:tetratricopeptide (TPR) repeat protein/TolB-like protein/predicted Ser/Thr protein kinase